MNPTISSPTKSLTPTEPQIQTPDEPDNNFLSKTQPPPPEEIFENQPPAGDKKRKEKERHPLNRRLQRNNLCWQNHGSTYPRMWRSKIHNPHVIFTTYYRTIWRWYRSWWIPYKTPIENKISGDGQKYHTGEQEYHTGEHMLYNNLKSKRKNGQSDEDILNEAYDLFCDDQREGHSNIQIWWGLESISHESEMENM